MMNVEDGGDRRWGGVDRRRWGAAEEAANSRDRSAWGSGDRGVVVWWSHGGEVGGCSDLEEEAWGAGGCSDLGTRKDSRGRKGPGEERNSGPTCQIVESGFDGFAGTGRHFSYPLADTRRV